MKSTNAQKKSIQFSGKIIQFYLSIKAKYPDLAKQIIKSGTSIGANIAEAQNAESKKDFIHKLSIALKEARETEYWLKVISTIERIDQDVTTLCDEICALLVSSIKTLKNK